MEEHHGILSYTVQTEIKQAVRNSAFHFKHAYGIEPTKVKMFRSLNNIQYLYK